MNRKYLLTLAALSCVMGPAPAALADEEAETGTEEAGERCIDTRRISRTVVVDAQTVLFYMRGGGIYRNTLPHKCMSLAREKRFSYRTSTSRLCDVDVITVLYDMGGLTRGPSCGLGKFYSITREEAEAIRQGPDADIEPAPIEPADMEQPEVAAPEDRNGD